MLAEFDRAVMYANKGGSEGTVMEVYSSKKLADITCAKIDYFDFLDAGSDQSSIPLEIEQEYDSLKNLKPDLSVI